jgi:hypothetical protein
VEPREVHQADEQDHESRGRAQRTSGMAKLELTEFTGGPAKFGPNDDRSKYPVVYYPWVMSSGKVVVFSCGCTAIKLDCIVSRLPDRPSRKGFDLSGYLN